MNNPAREQLAAGIETWVNRDWLILPGPVDMAGELAEHLAKQFEGWRPPARVIEDPAELDALPAGSVVMDAPYPDGDVYRRTSDGAWEEPGFDATCTSRSLSLPVVVLHAHRNGETE